MADTEETSFIVKLVDELTAPAKAARASLESLESSAIKSGKSAQSAGSSFMGISAGLGGLVTVARTAVDAVGALGGGLLTLGSGVVNSSASKQALEDSLGLLMKSKTVGAETAAEIHRIANTTPFQDENVASSIKMLVGAGYDAKRAFEIFKGVGDVSAFNGFSTEILSSMSLVMAKIKAKGKLDMHDLNSLMIDSGGLIQKDSLAKALGMTPAALEHAHLTAQQATDGILKVITESISGGKAGGLMDSMGKQIPGLVSNLKDVPFALVPSVDKSAGMSQFRTFLVDLVSVLSEGNPVFERMKELVASIIDGIGGLFAGFDKSSIEGGIGFVLDIFEGLRDVIAAVWPMISAFGGGLFDGMKESIGPMIDMLKAFMDGMSGGPNEAMISGFRALGKVLGYVVGALAWLELGVRTLLIAPIVFAVDVISSAIGWVVKFVESLGTFDLASIGDFFTSITDLFEDLVGKAVEWGAALIDGFVDGIKSGVTGAWDWTVGKFTELKDSVAGVFGIASPSKVFHGYGGNLTEGMKLGVSDGANDLEDINAMFGGVGSGLGDTSTGGGRGSVTNIYNVTVNVSGAGKDGAQIGKDSAGSFMAEIRAAERSAA